MSGSRFFNHALNGAASYTALVILLRLAGKRTLSQLNVFDFVVTVALGSILASVLLDSTISFTEGITALALLGGLQFSVASISSRWPSTRTIITADPVLLLANGQVRQEAVRRSRLTESEIRQAVRSSGGGDLSQIKAVVLESNGKISVITDSQFGNSSALRDVLGSEDL